MKQSGYITKWFVCCVAVVAVFFALHPLKPFHNKIIAGDGFGYYAYLPAQFIYHDTTLNFKWFDAPFYANYGKEMSANPTGNFLVPYKDKQINLYYPCLSFLQLPFFVVAHQLAQWLNYPPDGYSLPYQLGVGFGALFYALLGLWFCSKLIFKLTGGGYLSWLVPTLVFFGSNIFICSIYLGCYTHCYTFCFSAIGFYAVWRFFNEVNNKWLNVLLVGFCSLVIFFLRPMNILLLAGYFYFSRPFSIQQLKTSREEKKLLLIIILLLTVGLLYYNLHLTYVQTHTLFVNTYSGFKFYFNRWDHVWNTFASFQGGIFWYTPLAILCLLSVIVVPRQPKLLWIMLPLLAIIMLCGFWWYWKVISRTLADVTMLMAILLMHVLLYFDKRTVRGKIVLSAAVLCVPFYQLKDYQLRIGILNGFNTYRDYYLDYFFRIRPASVFPIDPKTVTARKGYFYDFETGSHSYITNKNKFSGQRSATLNSNMDFACGNTYRLPFVQQGIKKVKVSFWYYRSEALKDLRLILSFRRKDSLLLDKVFYINDGTTLANKWDYLEFGDWLPDNVKEGDVMSLYFWNPEKKDEVFIDDLHLEFVVTDGSDEMLM